MAITIRQFRAHVEKVLDPEFQRTMDGDQFTELFSSFNKIRDAMLETAEEIEAHARKVASRTV
jgi:hypothetical protein